MDPRIRALIPDSHVRQFEGLEWKADEIRFCVGEPMCVRTGDQEQLVGPNLTRRQLEQILQAACRQSVYSHNETIRQGYVSLEGGCRLGICGTGVVHSGQLQNLTMPSSLVIRSALEFPGAADRMLQVCDRSTLILGPPGSGKTSLLRDFIRQLSDVKKRRVAVADERGELSAMYEGKSQMRIGSRTDVMIHVPKSDAVMMLLRTMTPQWIAMDEITAPQDLEALRHASYCGVHLVATAHGTLLRDLNSRPLYRRLMEEKIFSYVVLLNADRTYEITEMDL